MIGSHGYEGDVEIGEWCPPASITDEQLAAVRRSLAEHDAFLEPCRTAAEVRHAEAEIGIRVVTMLGHYWVAEMNDGLRKGMSNDWVTILAKFPVHIVNDACQTWLSYETRKPTPGHIVAICTGLIGDAPKTFARLQRVAQVPVARPNR